MTMRIAFFGTPEFALPVLEALAGRHQIVMVVAQPDKAAGRGLKHKPPAVASRAAELGLQLEQPQRLKRNREFQEGFEGLAPDVAVTAAYGKILPQSLLEVPVHGFLNVHASLLPRYRGAAPIQWALIDGAEETGITIMQTEAGLDTGPIRLQKALPICRDDEARGLSAKLSELGAAAIVEALDLLEQGALPSVPQDERLASYARLLEKEDGRICWPDGARAIHNRFRGVFAWPGSWTESGGKLLKVHELAPRAEPGEPGRVLEVAKGGVLVGAGESSVLLGVVQPAGKPRMAARDWANGYGIGAGSRLG